MKHRPKHYLEYGILRALAGLVGILPYRAALSIAWSLARLEFHVLRFRVKDARARIREVFGDSISDREVGRIAWISLRNTCFNVIDVLRLPRMTPAWIQRMIEHADVHRLKEMLGGKGGVLAVPHAGSWDMGAVAASMLGIPMFIITRRQKNRLVDDYLNRMRKLTGMEVLYRDSASMLKGVLRNLKNGYVLAIMPDVRMPTPAYLIRFIGGEANLGGGAAVFARQADVPLFPAVLTRIGWTRHGWRLGDPVYPDKKAAKDADSRRMMQELMDQFDRAVREQPEQYFWYNKRWLLDPLRQPVR